MRVVSCHRGKVGFSLWRRVKCLGFSRRFSEQLSVRRLSYTQYTHTHTQAELAVDIRGHFWSSLPCTGLSSNTFMRTSAIWSHRPAFRTAAV